MTFMAKKKRSSGTTLQSLIDIATSLPNVEEGIACAGTSLEKRTMKTRKKAFVFLSAADLMVKLSDSLDEVAEFAATCKAGAHGWVTIRYAEPNTPPLTQLRRWIEESYRHFAAPTEMQPSKKSAR